MHLPFLKCSLVSQTHRDGTWQMPVYVHDLDYLYCVAEARQSASERGVRLHKLYTSDVTTQATLHDTTQRPNVQPTSLTHTDTVHVILLHPLPVKAYPARHTRTVPCGRMVPGPLWRHPYRTLELCSVGHPAKLS